MEIESMSETLGGVAMTQVGEAKATAINNHGAIDAQAIATSVPDADARTTKVGATTTEKPVVSLTDLEQEEADLDRRLSRIEGQVRGIRRMVAEGRDCKELSMQFAAVAKALDRAAVNYLTAHLVYCIENPEQALQDGTSLEELRRLLGRLR
jgi:DNA-binding FrmR family transcriptional regulator